MLSPDFALLVPPVRLRASCATSRAKRFSIGYGSGSIAVLEAQTAVAGLDDSAVVGNPIEQRGSHFGITEHGWPFAEC